MGNKLINDLTADCQAGSISACVKLAYEYTVGKNVPKDLLKAFQLYEIASQANNLTALFNLAQFLSQWYQRLHRQRCCRQKFTVGY